MKFHWNVIAHVGLLCLLGLVMSSCATKQCVDYRAYVKPPEKPAAAAVRNVLRDIPSTRETMFYGNYGGLGSNGGCPVDEMDELFRRHDIVYTEAKTQKMMRLADEVLVEYLKKLRIANSPMKESNTVTVP